MRWRNVSTWLTGVLLLALVAGSASAQPKPTDLTIVYPSNGTTSWPLWLAHEGGYFAKHGLNVKLEFALHPAGPAAVVSGEAFTHNLGLDTSILAAMKGNQLVIVSSPLTVGQFVLVGAKGIPDAKAIVGKRIGIGRPGDPPYFYALGLLEAMKIDVKGMQWIGTGAANQRALALRNGMVDAVMLTPPEHYPLLDEGYPELGNLARHRDVPTATSYLFRRKTLADTPQLVEAFLKGAPGRRQAVLRRQGIRRCRTRQVHQGRAQADRAHV